MKDPVMRAVAQNVLGMSDEDIDKVTPEQEKEYKNSIENMGKYRLVAEVVKSKYCAAGVKVGQKIVIDGAAIDAEATDCPLCVGAISPLERANAVYLDRCAQGSDVNAPLGGVACIDPGFEAGGLGNVVFDVRIEPKDGPDGA
jgi:uncharacterized repeat protein (TIGR04076 family)